MQNSDLFNSVCLTQGKIPCVLCSGVAVPIDSGKGGSL